MKIGQKELQRHRALIEKMQEIAKSKEKKKWKKIDQVRQRLSGQVEEVLPDDYRERVIFDEMSELNEVEWLEVVRTHLNRP